MYASTEQWMNKVWHIYEYQSAITSTTDTYDIILIDTPLSEKKKSQHVRVHTVQFHLYIDKNNKIN